MNVLAPPKQVRPKITWDQYGAPVPVDLVAMPGAEDLRWFPELVKAISDLPWYKIENILCVSRSAMVASLDAGITAMGVTTWKIKSSAPVLRVADSLKRYSKEDGFYNA